MTRRVKLLALLIAATITALCFASARNGDLILYNHSPSLPVGFYVRTGEPIARGAIVTIRARDADLAMARSRGFTGNGDRFIKRVAAFDGDHVCAHGLAITINSAHPIERRKHASDGRPLPTWEGCRTLGADQVFLLGDTSDSFDSRYWGPVSRTQIEGVWRSF